MEKNSRQEKNRNQAMEILSQFNRKLSNNKILKAMGIGFIILLLMIPASSIQDLLNERINRQHQTIDEISEKWSGRQNLSGPIVNIPVIRKDKISRSNSEEYDIKVVKTRTLHFLPEKLDINGYLDARKLHRSIYDVSVYEGDFAFRAKFEIPDVQHILEPGEELQWEKAFINLGISDLKGVQEEMKFDWNGHTHRFESGCLDSDLFYSGVHCFVRLKPGRGHYEFAMNTPLKGSTSLRFSPFGRETTVELQSNWPDPKFNGPFAPDFREVEEKGFNAKWKVVDLNRNYGQIISGSFPQGNHRDFGLELIQPVDHYDKSNRSIKYAILIICLSFVIFFFIELVYKIKIHPLQYSLAGLALIIFYLLLLSLSEHISFNLSYLLSATAVISLLAFYLFAILKDWRKVSVSSSLILACYGFIYITLGNQDYALLIGSIGLFIILAGIMLLSNRIQWHSTNESN